MIDAFVKSVRPIPDVPSFLAGFQHCFSVQVRDGGPTQIWVRGNGCWQQGKPGRILFEHLVPIVALFTAHRYDPTGAEDVVERIPLRLNGDDVAMWLDIMEKHRYAVEDAIARVGVVLDRGYQVECAMAEFPVSEMKKLTDQDCFIGRKVLSWIDWAALGGADKVSVAVSKVGGSHETRR